jgi:hypothetical protein
MRFWRTLIPDEPLISDSEVVPARDLKTIPPAVRAWCFVAIAANGAVVAIATAFFRNAAPLLVAAIFTMFPLWMLLFWRDLATTVDGVKQRAVESPFAFRINLSIQWCAISVCVCAPATTSALCLLLWFTQMRR